MKDGLPITKMVAFGADDGVVVNETVSHAKQHKNPHESYHIAEYKSEWEADDKIPPVKTNQVGLPFYLSSDE